MKQVLQDLKSGETVLTDVAAPQVKAEHLLIATTRSLISAGTERMLLNFGRASYLSKAKQQPEKVKQVLDKIQTDGLLPTIEVIQAKLDQPLPMGYCNVGHVLEVGSGVTGFAIGDRVVSNGYHAEIVCVPKNLCAAIPANVSDDQAVFTVVASIALQGMRLLQPTLGESVAVIGLGLVGLIAAQLLYANGVQVIGLDLDPARVAMARTFGIEAVDLSTKIDPIQAGLGFSKGRGVDGVLITAATQSHEVIHQAAQMSRQRGRIVSTGNVGLHLMRSDFYEKELTLQVSSSYGPGRYDPFYEYEGHDYPFAFVRWTVQRNLEAILALMTEGRIQTDVLISERFPLKEATRAYDVLSEKKAIGIILEYPAALDVKQEQAQLLAHTIQHGLHKKARGGSAVGPVVAVIGSGNYTRLKILPALQGPSIRLKWIVSSGGVSGAFAANKFGFEFSSTDYRRVLADPEVNAVFVTTPHSSHASITMEALRAGKNVFVEKPLCMQPYELEEIVSTYERVSCEENDHPILMVGFNRRFSPLVTLLREKIRGRPAPLAMSFMCNAGALSSAHWMQDPDIGGGRIIGEACHFVDLLHFIANAPIATVSALKLGTNAERDTEDTVAINLRFVDGSVGHINYFSTGAKRYPKERLEVFSDGHVLSLDNFKSLSGYGYKDFSQKRLWQQDKGHRLGFSTFLDAVSGGEPSPTSFASLVNVTRATFAIVESMRSEQTIQVEPKVEYALAAA